MFTITFHPDLLPMLIPDDYAATVEHVWVACFARRPQVTVSGITALGAIDGWQPFLPLQDRDVASAWAERFAKETTDPAVLDHLNWWPIGDGGFELYAVLDDGTETSTDLAIYPLTALAQDGV